MGHDGLKPDNSRKYKNGYDADGGYTDCYFCGRPIWVNGSPGMCSITCRVCEARMDASKEWDDKLKTEALRLIEKLEKDIGSLSMPELAERLIGMHEVLNRVRAGKEAAVAKAMEDAEALLDPPECRVPEDEHRKQKERERRELEKVFERQAELEFNYALCDGFPGASAQVTGFSLRKDALKAGQERWDGLSDEDKKYAWAGVSLAVVDVMNNVVKDWSAEERERAFKEQGDAVRAELREKVAKEEGGYVKIPAWRMAFHLPWELSGFNADKWVRDPETTIAICNRDEYSEGITVDLMSILEASPLEEDKVLLDDIRRIRAQKNKEE